MATKKKAQVAEETPVTAPLFVKHHYLILESADGTNFYVDRNAALTSRLIASALKELGNRADEELDDPTEAPQLQAAFTILGGDVEVKCNGEKAANAAAQFPIVHPSTLMAAMALQQQQLFSQQGGQGLRPNTADSNNVSVGRGGGGQPSNTKSKANQQQQANQESLAQALLQYHQVETGVSAMSILPITHLRLVHLNAPVLELAIRFMQYKYKNDCIGDAEARQGFFALVSNRSYQPQQGSSPFGFSSGGNSPPSGSASSPSKRKASMATGLMGSGTAPAPPAVDPITGGGIAHMPPVFSQKHLELLAASTLLQL